MRDYEFRGKCINNGKWTYGYYAYIGVKSKNGGMKMAYVILSMRTEDAESLTWYIVDPLTVGQFTGLYDKNGVKIYDGDIVCTPFLDPIFGDMMDKEIYYKQNWTVIFKDGSFVVDNGERLIYLYAFSQNGNVEVVGNIHDKENK